MSFIILTSIIIIISTLILVELVFRVYHFRKYQRNYHVSIKFPWDKSHVVPHPFLTFAYKRNSWIDQNQRLPYPIHTNKYFSYKQPLRINNMGHIGEDFTFDKPVGVLRIACLGHSSTANNIADEHRDYNYCQMLENYLNEKFADNDLVKKVEVYNCGIGGWVSIDIMIDFLLNIVHTKPDYVVLYYGYNDLYFQLNDDFELDYSHNRKNLGEVLHVIKKGYYFPKIRFWHSYECLKDKLFGTGNVRNEVLRKIITDKPKPQNNFHDLKVEMNILKNILIVCKYYGINIIISSFAYYDHEKTPLTNKLSQGVALENKQLKLLAEEFDAVFVDAAEYIPQKDDFFVDCVHFSPKGMSMIARYFGDAIVGDYKKKKCELKEEISVQVIL